MQREYIIGIIVLLLVGIGLFVLFSSKPAGFSVSFPTSSNSPRKDRVEAKQQYKEIVSPAGFINTNGEPIKIADYIGKKVILLDVMTYSCINCQRTFPYVTGWYEKYKDNGLIVIGIHTPEFAFEKNRKNVEEAMKKFGINFPVVLDNDYGTWNAYGNRYWPRKYLVDIKGDIIYDHIGEGAYEEIEMKIIELLNERMDILGKDNKSTMGASLVSKTIQKTEIRSSSPETYFGSSRNEYLANGEIGKNGEQTFDLPLTFDSNSLYLKGRWKIAPEYAETVSNSSVVYKYKAEDVYLVADAEVDTEIEVWQDGKIAGKSSGADINSSGKVLIKESRLYKIIHNESQGEHILELRVRGKGLRMYAFTFG